MTHNFQQLREKLELIVARPGYLPTAILSLIAFTELRQIIFEAKIMSDWRIFVKEVEEWVFIDKQLCELVDRLHAMGYHHTLKVELRLTNISSDPGEYGFSGFLPKFQKKGAVTIVRRSDSPFFYS